MVIDIKTKKDLRKFIYFIKDLYRDDSNYVFPLFFVQKKELTEIVLKDKTYKALLSIRNDKVVGRLLYTYDYSKKQGKKICYYSYFDTINDQTVVDELYSYMENDMRNNGIDYSEGTFSPFDPDTRRGVLIEGFDSLPSIFTSYNYEYYGKLLEQYGYKKAIDTVLLNAELSYETSKKLNSFSKFFVRRNNVRVDSLDFKKLERDLLDIEKIMSEATIEENYQDAPDIELIKETAKQMKAFINPKFVKIARENDTDRPVGFCLVLPDFNQVFKETKGRLRPLKMLLLKRKITRARGQLQYVVPDYQNNGLIGHIFKTLFDEFVKEGITDFEAGTMMEDNFKPITAFKKIGGDVIKVYRLYGKEL